MAAARERGGIRRGLLIGGLCTLLFVVFFAIRFPYEVFEASLVSQLGALVGGEVAVGELAGGFGLGGPSLVAEAVTVRWPDSSLALDRAELRPAWSLSWLRGRPAFHTDLRAPTGRIRGTIWPGAQLAFDGRVEDLALERLPERILSAAQGFALTGLLDADVDLALEGGMLSGELALEVENGAFAPPGSPISIPFERFDAAVAIDPAKGIRIDSAALEGPMVEGAAKGSIGLSADPALDLQVDIHVADPNLRGSAAPMGLQLDADGRASVRVLGTASNPLVR